MESINMSKRRLLWIGDAGVPTGFARVTNNMVPRLARNFDIVVLGIGYNGDPHDYVFKIYPAKTKNTDDQWGVARLKKIVDIHKPDLIIVNNDPWVVIKFLEADINIPVVG